MRHSTIAAMLLLAACSSAPTTIQPGQWEMTTQFSTIEAPGMPEAAVTAMRSQMANQPQTHSSCITPAQAANPTNDLMNPQQGGAACTFSESTFAGGVIRVRGTCPGPRGEGSISMGWEGSYTATTMQGQFNTEVQGGPQSMRMVGTMSGRRTGDCPSS